MGAYTASRPETGFSSHLFTLLIRVQAAPHNWVRNVGDKWNSRHLRNICLIIVESVFENIVRQAGYVFAAATPSCFGDPVIVDETLEQLDVRCIAAGDIVGIGIHTGNALRGYEIGS